MKTSKRKIEHLLLCAEKDVEAKRNYFDDVHLVHVALPEVDKDEIDTRVEFLGFELSFPMMIAAMTGGHPETKRINEALARAAEEFHIGMGVGSQRAALEDPSQEDSFRIVRDVAPTTFIYANIGALQLKEFGVEGVEKIIEMIDADAVAIHLNFLQEAIQPEGETAARGCLSAIKEACASLKVPVIVKETGAGMSYGVAKRLFEAGVSAIDVGGLGGTSWAAVETYRAMQEKDELGERLGRLFWNWGIPTPVSIVECSSLPLPIIATGGIRSGLEIAKSLALGADVCSAALPFVKPAMRGAEEVEKVLEIMAEELRVTMFLCGCSNIEELKRAEIIVTGKTREMLEQRGFLRRVQKAKEK